MYFRNKAVAAHNQRAQSTGLERIRMNVCQKCPAFTKMKTCKECGCFMPAKVRLENAKCPLGKW